VTGPATGYDAYAWDVVEQILAAQRPMGVVVTGGGSRAVSWLLNHPGASRVVVEAQVPYHGAAVEEYLGCPGPHRADEETARRLAAQAGARARRLAEDETVLGVGATAALATDRERKGLDRAFICTRSAEVYGFAALRFDRSASDRLTQEEVLSACIVQQIGSAAGARPVTPQLPPWAQVEGATAEVDAALEALLNGSRESIEVVSPDAAGATPIDGARILVPGSFNPFHAGHAGLAEAAERRSGRQASFELSVHNVDKAPLPYRDIQTRSRQPRDGRSLLLTREPTFLGKATVFPGSWFAIGYDTAVRLVEPAYYDHSRDAMERSLTGLRELGARFLVAGRSWGGAYRGLSAVPIPTGFEDLLEEIPEGDFRLDVSSTQLRDEARA
jgi:hypothetical protein